MKEVRGCSVGWVDSVLEAHAAIYSQYSLKPSGITEWI